MLFALALCHTIITDIDDNNQVIYNASSPDELALVNFARFCGVEYRGIDEQNNMCVKYNETLYKYELLQILEFNSKRYKNCFK